MKRENATIQAAKSAAAFLVAWWLIRGNKTGLSGPIRAKSRFMPVYIDGRPNPALIRANRRRPGVYMIKVNGTLRYIGYSGTHVYKTLIRHFQAWDDPRQVRITYPRATYVTARVIYTNTARQAAALEKALIIKYQPTDNPEKYRQAVLDLEEKEIINEYHAADVEAPF